MNKLFDITFIDFDHTLYNTHQLSLKIEDVFSHMGITGEEYQRIMQEAVRGTSGDYFNYSYERHSDIAKRDYPHINEQTLLAQLKELGAQSFQDKEAEQFMEDIREISTVVYLLTAGNSIFQKQKIDQTTLGKYFDDIIICNGDKPAHIMKYCTHEEKKLCINDNVKENEAIKQAIPDCLIVGRKHPVKYSEEIYQQSDILYFSKLSEIALYIRKQI
ncbi:MAG: hypothetical protein GW939_03740 [Candidatus Magasanikbacteria bacterium]|uniref:HAD family hydrolase n=1 Tax=Candidatus Magasanikbacteria bacterium CG10_big_fil_rev_8_21_14_0_10_38_6 TaxID=1974647 RepID=A0A2M6P0W9_9BACT|nr:hypothetical protein [Candidatus Magasanikbacteria bacterium]NCS71804.1 hypothetical protein [Candidatus Magasanikbacteria bacterium]PIR77347.1 MAG: hypothetical protein COU30_02975 [Candidatus Magasanikbacteria bacterium CG10_big_fil_rev_8_21_14_0_10_38_6]